jgi:hypothetical protein
LADTSLETHAEQGPQTAGLRPDRRTRTALYSKSVRDSEVRRAHRIVSAEDRPPLLRLDTTRTCTIRGLLLGDRHLRQSAAGSRLGGRLVDNGEVCINSCTISYARSRRLRPALGVHPICSLWLNSISSFGVISLHNLKAQGGNHGRKEEGW